jgi:hypothetical protein
MSIRAVHKSAKFGEELVTLEGQGQRAIDVLNTLRTRLPALRTAIQNDPDLSDDEKAAAVAEVNQAISGLVAQIKAFAAGL